MLVGIGFIAIGIFAYIKENYNMDIVDGEKEFNKKANLERDRSYRYKMLICIFSIVLGVFRIINTIIY